MFFIQCHVRLHHDTCGQVQDENDNEWMNIKPSQFILGMTGNAKNKIRTTKNTLHTKPSLTTQESARSSRGLPEIIPMIVKKSQSIIFPCIGRGWWISEESAGAYYDNHRGGSARSSGGLLEIIPMIVREGERAVSSYIWRGLPNILGVCWW